MDRTKYSGADWLVKNMAYVHPGLVASPLGMAVADLLGELFYGINHLPNNVINKVDWSDPSVILITIGWEDWSTFDFSTLTRLVFLAHHLAIRVDLTPVKYNYMRIMFHQRQRTGNIFQRHPTLQEAVDRFNDEVKLPEFMEAE